jgi:hypothetical protein
VIHEPLRADIAGLHAAVDSLERAFKVEKERANGTRPVSERASRLSWLNSNKGTKCDMAISLIPFDRWIFGHWATPKMGPPFSPPIFWGRIPMLSRSFSSEKSYSSSRLRCCRATAEPWAHRVEKRLPAGGILDLFQLLRKIEIIPANDAVLDEPLAGYRHLLVFFFRL